MGNLGPSLDAFTAKKIISMGQDRAFVGFLCLLWHMFLKQVEDKSLVKTEEVKDGHDLFLVAVHEEWTGARCLQ